MGMPTSVIIRAWIRDSLVPAVSSMRLRRCIAQSARPGTNRLGNSPYRR